MSATSQMLSDLAFELSLEGFEVVVVTSRQCYEKPKEKLPQYDSISGIEVFRVWSTRFGRSNLFGRAIDYLSFYPAAFLTLFRITHRHDVIIAKTDPPLISVIAWMVAKLKRAKLVNWIQDIFPEVAEALGILTWRPLIRLTRWLRNLSLKGASMNVVLGERMREYVCAQGVVQSKVRVITNWADGNNVKPILKTNNRLRCKWHLEDKFVVGYSGNMGRAHNFDTLIGAMKWLRDEKKIVFLFVGDGAGKCFLEAAVKEFDLDNCIFKPYQPRENLSESLSVPDVHYVSLNPSLEGLIVPSKIYGIIAAGRPSIFVGDLNGEIARVLNEFDCGSSFSIGSDKDLAEHIKILARKEEASQMDCTQIRDIFEQNFNKRHATDSWSNILRNL
ncbi:MAG: glycosyltransferase family 4 protein [Gammaproteobacteria bacterium]|nr:glycosyltransferase family 4 protein [Gammaproteobacteria bacterium]MCW8923426.1 glycosyltransferase family 4 protein [Gammaproteobacteria bacterium]